MYLYAELRLQESGTPWVVGHCIMHFNKSRIREYQYLRTHTYITNILYFLYYVMYRHIMYITLFWVQQIQCLTMRCLGRYLYIYVLYYLSL